MIPVTTLSDADLQRLEAFLVSDAVPKSAMNLATLEGFLTAVVIGPRVVPVSQWLPYIWDFERGQNDVEFAGVNQANEIFGLVFGMVNHVAGDFANDPQAFEPLYMRRPNCTPADWCRGFLAATQRFDGELWAGLWALGAVIDTERHERIGWVTPFLRLGDQTGIEITNKEGDAQRFIDAIVPSLVGIHRFWVQRRELHATAQDRSVTVRRESPKVGRNEPCPCRSGQKYKKCCGAAAPRH